MPKLTIITGPPGAGKSTITKLLAGSMENSARVSTDDMRDLILNGRASPNDPDWKRQLMTGAKNSSIVAKNFFKDGFNVFLDDVVCTREIYEIYSNLLKKEKPIFILLLPSKECVIKRDLTRGKNAMKQRAVYVYDRFLEFIKEEKSLIRIDTTDMSEDQTVKEIRKIIQ
jgi:adenylate kinase family enzyme